MAFGCFLQVLRDLGRNFLLHVCYRVSVLQKFGFGLAELTIDVFVLPQQRLD